MLMIKFCHISFNFHLVSLFFLIKNLFVYLLNYNQKFVTTTTKTWHQKLLWVFDKLSGKYCFFFPSLGNVLCVCSANVVHNSQHFPYCVSQNMLKCSRPQLLVKCMRPNWNTTAAPTNSIHQFASNKSTSIKNDVKKKAS